MGNHYDFTASTVTIRRFQTPAEGEKPGLDRMVFSFGDELGNKFTSRTSIEAANKELDRYVEERVSQRLTALAAPAEAMMKELRAAADEASSSVVALKAVYAKAATAADAALDGTVEEFKVQQKTARARINAAVNNFAEETRKVAPKVIAVAAPTIPAS